MLDDVIVDKKYMLEGHEFLEATVYLVEGSTGTPAKSKIGIWNVTTLSIRKLTIKFRIRS